MKIWALNGDRIIYMGNSRGNKYCAEDKKQIFPKIRNCQCKRGSGRNEYKKSIEKLMPQKRAETQGIDDQSFEDGGDGGSALNIYQFQKLQILEWFLYIGGQ